MKEKIKLSILDQSIIRQGQTATDAINETIATAKFAEDAGYYRYWVSEHHNATSIAGSAPELLMVKLADVTSRIRIGSGGIMLPNHSALKMAENFRMLETLFPNRIDMGMGRAPGSDRVTASLLNPSNNFSEESYLLQLSHLQHFFNDTAETSYGPLLAVPQSATKPQQWILSSSGGSSSIAAQFGMGLVVARFINGHAGPEMVDSYIKNFKPSEQFPSPQAMIATTVLCAPTEEKAQELRKLMDYRLLQFEKGIFDKPGNYNTVKAYVFNNAEKEKIKNNAGRIVSGTPLQVKESLTTLAKTFGVNEIMVTTMAGSVEQRMESFVLLAEAFELNVAAMAY